MKKYQFEVCANSVESCLAAQTGGANRVELCAGIPEGGTTPSYGEISMAREILDTTRLHVIIRPRGGDFLYSPIEVKTMLKDIEIARKLGVDGVVFGCLTANGEIDSTAMQELMLASQGLSVTFHRAFDVCCNPKEALEQIIELGCNRILTSGQQATAEQGIPLLKELQEQAAGRIILLAGCGVNENNIARIAQETGIQEFHFSARESIISEMKYKNESVSMGGTVHINEYERNVTTARRVMDTIQAISL
ncbi:MULTISPECIES: copper homeostasis protein CutC [Bacteroides]|jgi:copper homeostasis protein|uniref:PF03932 family protein CutC n=1 Tax=Bacteroides acidifaciens TaxID=85831 RepID=A0A3L8ACW4_9BACE|nr:copper homeostasis protein CutC [Bacteroides acidifaciens]MCR1999400.1 copper homeostasis protein CutC [Bacteroides acidifaciens]RLT81611.1 copper homeostasis protein CutC [Bacteroides acidifaciens]TGY07920.1 copper homeostasis protein CutC [Bacteroides acidifaciens]